MSSKKNRVVLLSITALSALVLAGCVEGPDPDLPDDDLDDAGLFARAEPLWHAPQDFPHPAFGWPTLTNPPEGENVPQWWREIPAAALPDEITGLSHLSSAQDIVPHGGGFAAFGSLISMPTYWTETYILDISDPGDVKVLSTIEESTRGAVMIPYPDGRLVTVYSTSNELLVYDITDPENPEHLKTLEPTQGSHKVGVVPGTPIVYNAASAGGTQGDRTNRLAAATGDGVGVTEIYNLTDPENPQHVMDFENGYSCHHVYFHIDPEENKYRAICAGKEMTQIWDIQDPLAPEVITEISMPLGGPFPSPAVSPAMLSHFSILSNDGNTLVVGDETGGGSTPTCDAYLNVGGMTISGPIGNLWFYDVSDESNPELMSWMSPSHHFPSNPPNQEQGGPTEGIAACTAHHGRLIPDDERDLLAMAFYGAGTVLVDFTDPAAPFIVDQWNDDTNTWEVWYYNGHIFTGDLSRGMDVFVLE